jgi:hypothetical protein
VLGEDHVRESWSLGGEPNGSWLGSGNTLVVATQKWNPATLALGPLNLWMLRSSIPPGSARVSRLGPAVRETATIRDLDVDAGVAVIKVDHAIHLVKLGDGSTVARLWPPGCSNQHVLQAGIERGGDRVYVQSGREVAVFRRSTGTLIGAAQLAAGGTIAFVPHHDEVLAGGEGDVLALWNVVTGAQRVVPHLAGLDNIAVSPDGRRAALAFNDGRVAVADLDALRAAMEPRAAPSVTLPDHCDTASPFVVEGDGPRP